MAVADEDVAKIRAATDIAALIGEHTALKRVGRRLVGLCPFHGEKTPSFSVNAEEGLYHCFGCQKSGDAISFVREVEHCGFVEAVERLAARAGIVIEVADDPAARAERGRRRRLADAMTKAVDWYHALLLESPEAGRARQYLRSRGLDGDTVRRFRIGFAPAGPDALIRALDAPVAVLSELGLAWTGARGRPIDVFRERVIFPIFDPGGQAIAVGGRILPEALRRAPPPGRPAQDPGPKYRNSAESPLYLKRRTLYGLNWAKSEIARSGEVVVCEGYTDVIGCFSSGVERAVATCGTSLTEDHVKVLANFAKRVVLAFDADAAGQNAAARLYEWERRHEIELAVAALPPGSDPGELAQHDPQSLAAAIAGARPFLAFVVERALASVDLSTPEGRARGVQAALRAVADHPDGLVRDQYLVTVADRTRHDPDRLREELPRIIERRRSEADREAATLRARPSRRSEPAAAGRPGSGRPAGRQHAAGESGDWPREPPADWGEDEQDAPTGPDRPDRPAGAAGPARGARRATPGGGGGRAGAGAPRAGRHVLLHAVHHPAELAPLIESGVLDVVLFTDPTQRRAFEALLAATELHGAIAAAQPDAAELLVELAVQEEPVGAAGDAVLALARHAAEQALRGALAEARLAEAAQDGDRHAAAADTSRRLLGLLGPLRDPLEAGEAAGRSSATALVGWLSQQALEGR